MHSPWASPTCGHAGSSAQSANWHQERIFIGPPLPAAVAAVRCPLPAAGLALRLSSSLIFRFAFQSLLTFCMQKAGKPACLPACVSNTWHCLYFENFPNDPSTRLFSVLLTITEIIKRANKKFCSERCTSWNKA